jgi:hypothetical protein
MELKVQSERVVAAAAKCGDAANVLKELFPEAFKVGEFNLEPLGVNLQNAGDVNAWIKAGFNKSGLHPIQLRLGGPYHQKAFWLDSSYGWRVEKECAYDATLLVPSYRSSSLVE